MATDKLAAEMLAGLEGVPAGPWDDGIYHAVTSGGRTYAYVRAPNLLVPLACVPIGVEGYGRPEGEATARHLARLSPDNIRALLEERSTDKATISALEAENKRLREREASLYAILNEMVDRDLAYDGGNIVIPIGSHGNAIALVRRARDLSRNRRETP